MLSAMNKVLENKLYLTGDNFSVADVAVGSILGYGILMLKLSYAEYPALDAYIKRIGDRPAYKKAISDANLGSNEINKLLHDAIMSTRKNAGLSELVVSFP